MGTVGDAERFEVSVLYGHAARVHGDSPFFFVVDAFFMTDQAFQRRIVFPQFARKACTAAAPTFYRRCIFARIITADNTIRRGYRGIGATSSTRTESEYTRAWRSLPVVPTSRNVPLFFASVFLSLFLFPFRDNYQIYKTCARCTRRLTLNVGPIIYFWIRSI